MTPNRHAIVTGGGSGIGLAIARELAGMECCVTIMGRSRERLAAAAAQVEGVRYTVCDVTELAQVEAAVAAATTEAGPVSIIVNNAGLVRTASFARQSDADWNLMWRTNVMGAVNVTRCALGQMLNLPSGRIINIASTAALKPYGYVSAYVATKHALLGLTRALALELASSGVTVNAICPGYADTDIVSSAVDVIAQRTGRSPAEARATFTEANPQGRLTDPGEVAGAVRWLVSDAARGVTGQAIAVAGGEVM